MSARENRQYHFVDTLADFNIVQFDFVYPELSKIDIIELEEKALSGIPDEKYFSLIEVNDYLKLKGDVKEYLISEERSWRLAGEAIVVNSFSQKLILDFYFQFNLPLVPTKTFTQRNDAIYWLERIS